MSCNETADDILSILLQRPQSAVLHTCRTKCARRLTRRIKSNSSCAAELSRLSRRDSHRVNSRIGWKTSCSSNIMLIFGLSILMQARKKRTAAANAIRLVALIGSSHVRGAPKRTCLSLARSKLATRKCSFDVKRNI